MREKRQAFSHPDKPDFVRGKKWEKVFKHSLVFASAPVVTLPPFFSTLSLLINSITRCSDIPSPHQKL